MYRVLIRLSGSLLLILLSAATATAADRVRIESGELQGVIADDVVHFLGIPYASPPVGELRWRAPQPVVSWDTVRDASEQGHACPQPVGKYSMAWVNTAIAAAGIDEDCLTVNIWAPGRPGTELLPVMFYMHGGNMQYGSNVMPLYDGTELAKQGVVLVVVNYRLGYLGRFAHPAMSRLQEGEALGNYGLYDQIAALEWVQRNIAAFGGDSGNVMIFGHSAGGVSVNFLMTTPQSKGLFHSAIAMGSGVLLDKSMHITESLPRGLAGLSGEELGELFAEHFEVTADTDQALVRKLRNVDWHAIIDYQESNPKPFNPYVDGTFVVDHLPEVFERGEQHNVPYIGGANSYEWNQIAHIPLIVKWFLGGAMIAGLSEDDLAIFDDQWTRIGLSQRWFAEGLFLSSTRYLTKQMATVSAPAWQYRTDYQQTAVRGENPGSVHGLEMPYVFGQLAEHPEYQRPPEAAVFSPSAEDLRWGDTVRGYWLNMARTGNPNGSGLPEWPEYQPASDVTLVMGEAFTPVQGLSKDVLDFLEERALIRRRGYDQSGAH